MDPSKEVSASEKERKPAGEESEEPSSKLLRTSSGMLTLSEEECLDLKTEISWPEEELRFMKRPSMLDVPALLLTTLEEFTEEQLKTFQSNLTSVQLPGFPLIPESQLENTDRQDTVDQMVKRYGPERAVEITLNTMRKMDLGDLAEKLERDHRGVLQAPQKTLKEMPSSTSHSPPRTPDSPLLLEPNDPIVGQAFTLPSATDGTMEEESQDCVRVHLSDSLPEAMDELNITECRVVDQSLCTTDPRMRSPENFEPEIYDREDKGAYRFQCLRSGLFQCSITGLVFRMEGEGEVLYRTVPWNRRLLAKRGKRPAGPLFNIDCSQKSVCQLHLPHCEIHSEGGCDFLSVAHVTDDDSMEFLHPHETTETHVILNINGFSKYGITKDKKALVSPIRGLVLLFYQLPDDTNNSTLNVLLLPRNVDIDEVCEKRRRRNGDREIYIEINPNCRLTPDQEYTLSTDLTDEHHIDPKEAEFVDYDSYTNYMPTFLLRLKTVVEEVNLLLEEHDGPENECVWNRLVSLPASPTEVKSTATPQGGATAGTTTNVSNLLLGTLTELVSEQLERFQWHLSQGVEDFPSIPKSQLENATRQATVDMMVQRYHDDGTVKITLEILRKMGQNKLAIELKEKLTNECLNVQPQHNMSE